MTNPAGGQAAVASRRTTVLRALDALEESDRLVLALEMCDGLTIAEISEILEITPRDLARRREHALTAIRRAVAGRSLPVNSEDAVALRRAV